MSGSINLCFPQSSKCHQKVLLASDLINVVGSNRLVSDSSDHLATGFSAAGSEHHRGSKVNFTSLSLYLWVTRSTFIPYNNCSIYRGTSNKVVQLIKTFFDILWIKYVNTFLSAYIIYILFYLLTMESFVIWIVGMYDDDL